MKHWRKLWTFIFRNQSEKGMNSCEAIKIPWLNSGGSKEILLRETIKVREYETSCPIMMDLYFHQINPKIFKYRIQSKSFFHVMRGSWVLWLFGADYGDHHASAAQELWILCSSSMRKSWITNNLSWEMVSR
jgi:hypothetical protein